MAVVNIYKFYGVDGITSTDAQTMFGSGLPLVNETYLIKSIKIQNKFLFINKLYNSI